MRKWFTVIVLIFVLSPLSAQELNCEVVINAEKTGKENQSVFQTLQRALTEFVNQTTWTDKKFQEEEKVSCSMFITINSFEGESFSGTIQVQSSRPVYGSTMVTPVFNFNDEQFSFNYREYQPLNYSQNSYSSNLVSVISYYVYTILGIDADTFAPEGGTAYFEEAKRIVSTAQQGGQSGWKASDGTRSRYRLNTDLLANTYAEYRQALYQYHRQGLDVMYDDVKAGKEAIAEALIGLKPMNDRRSNSLLMRTFFDAKADEVSDIFSGGPEINKPELQQALNDIAPRYSKNWRNLQ